MVEVQCIIKIDPLVVWCSVRRKYLIQTFLSKGTCSCFNIKAKLVVLQINAALNFYVIFMVCLWLSSKTSLKKLLAAVESSVRLKKIWYIFYIFALIINAVIDSVTSRKKVISTYTIAVFVLYAQYPCNSLIYSSTWNGHPSLAWTSYTALELVI